MSDVDAGSGHCGKTANPIVAVAQVSSVLGDPDANIASTARWMHNAAAQGAQLTVFPECTLSGYMMDSRTQVEDAAVAITGQRLAPLIEAASATCTFAVVGLLERDGDKVYNSAVLIGPDGVAGTYRKQHLPRLGADLFVDPGDGVAPRVYEAGPLRVGIMICFDLRFPESARELALGGADVIAMPTNWPLTAGFLADHMTRVRAVENLVYVAVADRCDRESDTDFLGRSQVVAPSGEVLVDAGTAEGIVVTSVDVTQSRTKTLTFDDPPFSLPVFQGRRPELYSALTRPTAPPT
ncbi:carbon-nitrogen hydrolase family protein [Mycobacterium sp. 21AC1]|uniref:carbon-nitrogen hydrolase family protein n=1 Tax=[Mycobacterium] appelbergii TaxID=2939269 RepID=UPI002939095F|nr:carbon-nitrogen hydrolase family protein [Mycobacterium sp. 21AC1]MDV3125859.1 carbon-nitrogen hydrolase family protein [Mycobacterium sp. 21AC1]